MEEGALTFPAGLPSSEPVLEGAQWDPAPAPRGPAGTRYHSRAKKHRQQEPSAAVTREGNAAWKRTLPAGRSPPPRAEHAQSGLSVGRGALPGFRSVRGWDRSEVAQALPHLLAAGRTEAFREAGVSSH